MAPFSTNKKWEMLDGILHGKVSIWFQYAELRLRIGLRYGLESKGK